ncbi:MAG: PAS domain S-box protein, partial [Lysobacteraceae bacterium]
MKIRSLFITAGALALLVGLSALAAMWMATRQEARAEAQQHLAQQVARDVAGLVGVTYVFQRERDELSVSEWQRWHASIVRDLAGADLQEASPAEVELLKDAAGRLPTLFERALKTSAAPASEFERRRHDQAFELLLGDTQAMADAAFRWSRNAGDARRLAEDLHEQVSMGTVITFGVLLILLAIVAVRRVLRPLARLTQATEALERGEQVPLFGSTAKDELGTLKRRFDAMTIALQRRNDELREAEQRMRAIADNIPVLITEFDVQGRIVFANATAGRVYGMTAEALIGKHVSDVRGEDGERQLRPHIDAVLQGESVEFDSTQALHGAQRHFHQLYVPRRDALDAVVGFYSVSMDITERKAAELAVQASEQRLKAITDNIPVVVSHFDKELRADFGNLAAERVLRRPIAELMGLTFREIRGEAVWEIAKPHIDAVLRGQPQEFESFVTHGDGTLYFAQRYVPDTDATGKVQGFYSVSFDITERRQAEAQLAASEKRLRDITDNLPVMISYIDKDQRLLFLNQT